MVWYRKGTGLVLGFLFLFRGPVRASIPQNKNPRSGGAESIARLAPSNERGMMLGDAIFP